MGPPGIIGSLQLTGTRGRWGGQQLPLEFFGQCDDPAGQACEEETGGQARRGQDRSCNQPGQLAPLDLSKKKLHTQIVRRGTTGHHRACP